MENDPIDWDDLPSPSWRQALKITLAAEIMALIIAGLCVVAKILSVI